MARSTSCSVPVPNICIGQLVCKSNCSALQLLYFLKGHGISEVFAHFGWLNDGFGCTLSEGRFLGGFLWSARWIWDAEGWQDRVAGPLAAIRCEEGGKNEDVIIDEDVINEELEREVIKISWFCALFLCLLSGSGFKVFWSRRVWVLQGSAHRNIPSSSIKLTGLVPRWLQCQRLLNFGCIS